MPRFLAGDPRLPPGSEPPRRGTDRDAVGGAEAGARGVLEYGAGLAEVRFRAARLFWARGH